MWNEDREEATGNVQREMLSVLAEYAKTKNIRLAMESLLSAGIQHLLRYMM